MHCVRLDNGWWRIQDEGRPERVAILWPYREDEAWLSWFHGAKEDVLAGIDFDSRPTETSDDRLYEWISSIIEGCLLCATGTVSPREESEPGQDGSADARKLCKMAASLRQQWQEEENVTEAEDLFREAMQKSPGLWLAHFGVGEILLYKAACSRISSGPVFEDGVKEVSRAVELDSTQAEPLSKLANALATVDFDAAEKYCKEALQALQADREPFYPDAWQAGDLFEFAIEAAERDHHDIAVEAFCYAIRMNDDYAGHHMPQPDKANADWQAALRELGRTEWFEQRSEHDDLMKNILAGMPLDDRTDTRQQKTGCLAAVLLLLYGATLVLVVTSLI